MRRLSFKTKLFSIILFYSLVVIWAISYYSKEVPVIRGEPYKKTFWSENYKEYRKYGKPKVAVYSTDESNRVKVGDHEYTVYVNAVNGLSEYTVIYPDGMSYIVKGNGKNKQMETYNMDGSLYDGFSTSKEKSIDNIKLTSSDYDAESIVKVAYESNFEKRGSWQGFLLSFALLNGALLVFFSSRIQMNLFKLFNRRNINSEPSGFYFTSTKTFCLFAVSAALIMMIMSL